MLYSRAVEKRLKRLPDGFYYSVLLPLLALLPARAGYAAARRLGSLVARNFPAHRRLLMEKLRTHLPAEVLDGTSVAAVADEFYRILVAEDFDAFHYPKWNAQTIHSVFSFEGLDILDSQQHRGEGAVLVSGHVGGVSSALVALGVMGYPLTHVAREYPEEKSLPGPFYRYAMHKVALMEEKLGRPLIYAGAPDNPEGRAAAVLQAGRTLKQGGMVSMAMDVPPFRVTQVSEATFLGSRCRFPLNFVRLASDSGVPLIPFFTWRESQRWWRQVLAVQSPIQPSGDLDADLQACVSRLEEVILAHPENWFSWDSIDHFMS